MLMDIMITSGESLNEDMKMVMKMPMKAIVMMRRGRMMTMMVMLMVMVIYIYIYVQMWLPTRPVPGIVFAFQEPRAGAGMAMAGCGRKLAPP